MCASIGMTGTPFAPVARRGRPRRAPACAPSGAPLAFGAADRLLLVVQRRAVPDLDQHADPARDEVRCRRASTRAASSAGPRRASSSASRVLELDVVRPVLEAHQVARRVLRAARRRRAAEAELRPAHHDAAAAEPREVAHGVERDLRVVGAGLHAEVAAAARRVERVVARTRAAAVSAAGRFAARPKRSSPSCTNSDGPEAEGDREARGREADRLAGVVGRRVRVVVARARPARPAVIRAAAAVHVRSRSRRSCGRVGRRRRRRRSGAGPAPASRSPPGARRRTGSTRPEAASPSPRQALDAEAAERECRTARARADQQLAG